MSGAWSCPHAVDDVCTRVADKACQPGMKGCVLYRRYVIFDGDRLYPARARAPDAGIGDLTLAAVPPKPKA